MKSVLYQLRRHSRRRLGLRVGVWDDHGEPVHRDRIFDVALHHVLTYFSEVAHVESDYTVKVKGHRDCRGGELEPPDLLRVVTESARPLRCVWVSAARDERGRKKRV